MWSPETATGHEIDTGCGMGNTSVFPYSFIIVIPLITLSFQTCITLRRNCSSCSASILFNEENVLTDNFDLFFCFRLILLNDSSESQQLFSVYA